VTTLYRVEPDSLERLPSLLQRLADLGASEADTDDLRLRKRVLNLAAAFITSVSPLWVVTYLVLGHWLSAAIPAAYIAVTAGFVYAHSQARWYRAFRFGQLVMYLLLPFALQWSLGGFANSSAVALWGLTAPLAAIFFVGARQAPPWFGAFAALVVLSGLLDPALSESPPHIPDGVVVGFFTLDLLAVSTTVFLLLQYFVRAREAEQARSERLLLNVLPAPVARRLKETDSVIADAYPEATVLFADIVDFTPLADGMDPAEVVQLLDSVFTTWDEMAAHHGLEKIKTIGDAYMVVGGVPVPRRDHAAAVAEMALEMRAGLAGRPLSLRARIGVDTGPVVAGVIGRSKFTYDLWGDTVNTASRMESSGVADRIQVTGRMRDALPGSFCLDCRGEVAIKGKGPMTTYFLNGKRPGFGTT
jgi:class 3 adenylate cyclase